MYTHMSHTHEVSYPHLSDEQIAHMVRMLMRSDLRHESIVVAARDRLLYLIAREEELLKALEFYADPFAWKKLHDPDDTVRIPDFYSETDFGATAQALLRARKETQSP